MIVTAHQPEKHYSTIVLPFFFIINKTCYVCNKICYDCNIIICYDAHDLNIEINIILISIMIDFIELIEFIDFIDFIDSIPQALYQNDHTWTFFELILNLFEEGWTQRSCKFELPLWSGINNSPHCVEKVLLNGIILLIP